jgi:Low psii accumulation1 / Rep27
MGKVLLRTLMDSGEIAHRRALLRAEALRPWRKVRLFFYVAFGASGFIGFWINLFRVIAGREPETSVPNLVIQSAVMMIMFVLWKIESQKQERLLARFLALEEKRGK